MVGLVGIREGHEARGAALQTEIGSIYNALQINRRDFSVSSETSVFSMVVIMSAE